MVVGVEEKLKKSRARGLPVVLCSAWEGSKAPLGLGKAGATLGIK
jgi:hypothetical protein